MDLSSSAHSIGSHLSLHIHHGSHLVPLVDVLAATFQQPLADPFEAEVVSVPTAGMRDWLQQQLAFRLGAGDHRDGVAANIDMVFPGRFTAAVLGQALDTTSPWDLDRLTWTVLAALESGEVDVPGWRGRRRGTYSTARRIADLFDRYSINRPQLLQQWQAGHDGDGTEDEHGAVVPVPAEHRWQPRLWRLVREAIGEPNPAERLPDLLADLRAGRVQPRLPERVAAFGVSAISTAQLTVLRSLAAVREVHLHLVHPSPAAWSGSRQQLGGRLVLRSACDASANVQHPLLRSWGRPAMEAAVLVGGLEHTETAAVETSPPDGGFEGAVENRPTSLLAEIQHALRADTDPHARATAGSDPRPDAAGDDSIQIHACHGTVRQLEVLRDALGHLFAADPTLSAHDIVVLCPDLARFAPLVGSVFQRSALPVPVRVTDLSLGTDNPVASALVDVLAVIGGRCTGPEILGLCSLEPVRHAFGFDDDAIERIDRWIGELGISWGLDASHRSRWVPETIAEGTWRASLDRLLLGAAMPAPVPRVGPSGIVPFDDVDAAALVTVGQLAEVIERLDRLHGAASTSHPIDEWVVLLTNVVHALFSTTPTEAWQTVQVMETIAEIGRHAGHGDATNPVPLSLDDVRALLTGVLSDQRGRLNLRSGAVTVTTMVPVRNLPYRVVCLLGLDEGALRSGGGDGDDLLALRPCVGERDPRAEGRHLLLDALMAARDHLLITCDGSDITTNRPLPMPVHVAELLDIVRAHRPRWQVVTRHPRQAFDERNFGIDEAGGSVPAFSFDRGMLAAAALRRHATREVVDLPVLAPLLPPVVGLTRLADALTRPAKTYLGQRLDVRLPRPVEDVETDIPLGVDPLELRALAIELLDHHRRGGTVFEVDQWREAKRRSGALPPRQLADAVIDDVQREVGILLSARQDMADLLVAADTADIDLALTTDVGPLRVQDTINRIHDDLLVRVEFSRPKQRHRVLAALELAALVVTRPDRPWTALVVTRSAKASNRPAVVELRPAPGSVAAATHLLTVAGTIYARALREPIPMFDASLLSLALDATIVDEEFENDLRDNETGFIWGEATPDEVLALTLRDHDIPALTAFAAAAGERRRAVALAQWLWAALEAFVPLGGGS